MSEGYGFAGAPVPVPVPVAGIVTTAVLAVVVGGVHDATGVGVYVFVGEGDAVKVAVTVLVAVAVFVGVEVFVGVNVSVGVGDAVAVLVGVAQVIWFVVMFNSHPPAMLPRSVPTSSRTYSDHVPFGLEPANVCSKKPLAGGAAGAGAGAGNMSVVVS